MIMGQEKQDSGTLRIGERVLLSYVNQFRDALNPDNTVYEEISGGLDQLDVGETRIHARNYVGRFNFQGPDQQKLVKQTIRRRAQPRSVGQAAALGRQFDSFGRTDQRPGRRYAAIVGRGVDEFRRLRCGRQSRSLVSGPNRHSYPGIRG